MLYFPALKTRQLKESGRFQDIKTVRNSNLLKIALYITQKDAIPSYIFYISTY